MVGGLGASHNYSTKQSESLSIFKVSEVIVIKISIEHERYSLESKFIMTEVYFTIVIVISIGLYVSKLLTTCVGFTYRYLCNNRVLVIPNR